MTRLRCAIYTRKSTEEGLDQDFNSLDAQREACEAFIASQKSEGWRIIRTAYDDGGLSGGTMERPALLRLLDDVRSGRVDIIVVYKVDRLTRSLADFAKIVEILDTNDASFVSVTQAFNTTTSMGRLTLNVLLSFAQFEREVTAERIRDKIAASRKKGMWMGGPVPLGYDVIDKKLVINATEAETIRSLFRLYLDLDTMRDLAAETKRRGYLTKKQVWSTGRTSGGCAFTRGRLYHLLRNPLYIGRVRHKEETYEGQHNGIIDKDLWNAVQAKLDGRAIRTGKEPSAAMKPLLLGLLHDEDGKPLTTNHAVKNGKRYGYYVSRQDESDDRKHQAWRLPAPQIETTVLDALRGFVSDPVQMMDAAAMTLPKGSCPDPSFWSRTKAPVPERADIPRLLSRVDLARTGIKLHVDMHMVAGLLGHPSKRQKNKTASPPYPLYTPICLRRRGSELRMVIASTEREAAAQHDGIITMVARAHSWFDDLKTGTRKSMEEIATEEGMSASDVSRYLPLAFLAPDIIEAFLDGKQPAELTLERIKRLSPLPMDWQEQRIVLGIAG